MDRTKILLLLDADGRRSVVVGSYAGDEHAIKPRPYWTRQTNEYVARMRALPPIAWMPMPSTSTDDVAPESDPTQVAHPGEMPSQPADITTLGLSAESIAEIEQLPGESKRLVLSAIGQTSRPTVRLVVTVSGESPDANWYDAIIPAGLPDQVHRLIAAGLLFDARWSDVAFTFIVEAV